MSAAKDFDVIVVGARCAGATLATLLARGGARVLALDRDPLPSDQVLSTHTIHPPGVDILDELGVGASVREVTPASPRMRFRKGRAWADVSFPDGRAELCPRRERLDGLLQEAAVAAGVELQDRTKVTEVLFEDGRAVGVTAHHDGHDVEIRADLVVGADGRRSIVASEVGAEEYMGYDAPRAMYWAYWDMPPEWRTEAYPFDMYIGHVGPDVRVVFQTDHDQLLIGSLPSIAEAQSWKTDAEAALLANLREDEFAGALVGGRRPTGPVRGTVKERYFFRRGAGPGWALVGDAGHHKEFVVGDGITEALIQARSLAVAIEEGTDTALQRWWRQRDVHALPAFFWGRDEGTLDPPMEIESRVVAKVARSERLQALMTRLPEHRCSPYEAIPPTTILPTVLGALLRGRFGVLREARVQAGRAAEYEQALRERLRLLKSVEA